MASRKGNILSANPDPPLAGRAETPGHSHVWIVTAGVPCQDVSVAGKRAGLAGTRTGLFFEFARVLREVRSAWFVFENVPGLLSSNRGRDFAEVLRVLMVECGYGVSWRVLDSRFFGVAQRRRRVFVVGSLGKPCPAEILFEPARGGGNPAPCGEARTDIAVTLTSGVGVTGNAPGRRREDDFNLVCGPLGGSSRSGGFIPNAEQAADGHLIAAPIDGSWAKGGSGKSDYPVGLVLGRRPDSGYVGLLDVGKGPDDARKTAFSLRSDPGGIGQAHNTNYVLGGDPEHEERASELSSNTRGNDGDNGISDDERAASDSNRVRDFAGLPEGLDSPRYRGLGNAVTVQVVEWIIRRIIGSEEALA